MIVCGRATAIDDGGPQAISTPTERAAEVAALHAAARVFDRRRDVSRANLYALLRRLAVNGDMPLQWRFNRHKPAQWPTASQLVRRLGTTWFDLAMDAGLTYGPHRGRNEPCYADTLPDLAAYWPSLEDMPDGVDVFADKYGEPTGEGA